MRPIQTMGLGGPKCVEEQRLDLSLHLTQMTPSKHR
jgi:hypothetical protein